MLTLFHHPFCPHSRFIRLALAEHGLEHRAGRGAGVGAARGVPDAQPGRHHAGAGGGGLSAGAGRRRSSPNISTRPRAPSWTSAGCCRPKPAGASRCGGWPPGSTRSSSPRSPARWCWSASTSGSCARAGRRPARHRRDPCGARSISAIIWPISAGWCAPRDWLAGDRMSYRRSRRGRASVGGRLSGRRAVERRRGGEELVRAGEVAAVVPSAAGRDGGRGSRRRRATPTSTSERSGRPQGRAASRPRARTASTPSASTRPDADRRRPSARLAALPRRRRAWRHGLAGDDRRAARRSARAVAGGALRHHARHELRAGRRSARDPRTRATAARSRSTPRATTITRSSSRG